MADRSEELTPLYDDGPCGTGADVRLLTPGELAELRRDMVEASAWARAELKRRRAEKRQEKS